MAEFVRLLNGKITDSPSYTLFMPLLSELAEQTAGRINPERVAALIGAMSVSLRVRANDPLTYLQANWRATLATAGPRSAAATASAAAGASRIIPAAGASNVAHAAAIVNAASSSPATATAQPSPVTPSSAASASTPAAATPSSAVIAVAVAAPARRLLRDAADDSGGTIKLTWEQRSIFNTIGLPADTFNGFCATAVGEFLKSPDTIDTKLRSQRGKIDLINAHRRYAASGKSSYAFITDEFGLTFSGVTAVAALNPVNTLRAIETHAGTRHMIGLTRPGGRGHALGLLITAGPKYLFFDAEEGVAEVDGRDAFWRFLHKYITRPAGGLAADFANMFVATWR
jgi:hypothetical protein